MAIKIQEKKYSDGWDLNKGLCIHIIRHLITV